MGVRQGQLWQEIGPYFFENVVESQLTGTVNKKICRIKLNTFLKPAVMHLPNHQDVGFQQHGVGLNTVNESTEELHEMFGITIDKMIV